MEARAMARTMTFFNEITIGLSLPRYILVTAWLGRRPMVAAKDQLTAQCTFPRDFEGVTCVPAFGIESL